MKKRAPEHPENIPKCSGKYPKIFFKEKYLKKKQTSEKPPTEIQKQNSKKAKFKKISEKYSLIIQIISKISNTNSGRFLKNIHKMSEKKIQKISGEKKEHWKI